MSHPQSKMDAAATAKLLVVLLAFAWGLNWIAAAIALARDLALEPARRRLRHRRRHSVRRGHRHRPQPAGAARRVRACHGRGFLNVAAFQVLSGFAQLSGATSRAIIITYSMPIWTTVLSRLVLGERLNAIRWFAFGLCVAGVTILVWPLFAAGFPPFVFYSLGCALSWAIATVYIKWAKVTVEPLANAAWQLLFGLLFIVAGSFVFEGFPHLWPLHAKRYLAILFVGIVRRRPCAFPVVVDRRAVPTMTASLGSLLVPVIGVTASAIVLGERPTVPDMIGFAMIFAAAACVLLQPNASHAKCRSDWR